MQRWFQKVWKQCIEICHSLSLRVLAKHIDVLYFYYIWDGKYIFDVDVDDQHRNTNMNDKDHLVGQLTSFIQEHQRTPMHSGQYYKHSITLRSRRFPVESSSWPDCLMLWDDTPLHPKEKPNQPHHLQLQLQHLHHCLLLFLLLTSASFENKCFEAGVFGFPGSEPVPSACWVGLRCKVIQWLGQSHTQSAGQSTLCTAHTHTHITHSHYTLTCVHLHIRITLHRHTCVHCTYTYTLHTHITHICAQCTLHAWTHTHTH